MSVTRPVPPLSFSSAQQKRYRIVGGIPLRSHSAQKLSRGASILTAGYSLRTKRITSGGSVDVAFITASNGAPASSARC